MKKQNWIGISLIGGLVCFIAFGGYMVFAKNQNTFILKDVQGDRAYLKAFPLEGYGGDDTESVDFTIIDGNLETKYHPYSVTDMSNTKKNRAYGENKLLSYICLSMEKEHLDGRTWIVPTKNAKLEYTQENNMRLFDANDNSTNQW